MYAKCAAALLLLVGSVLSDGTGHNHAHAQSGYSAPSQAGYSAPAQSGYGAPDAGYGAPDAGYGAPDAGYGAPDSGYGAPAQGYGAPSYDYDFTSSDEGTGLDFSKLGELLPLFLAVLAAIILASLLAPLLSQLFVLIVGLLPLALNIKAPIINALLAPFGLVLCNPVGPTIFPAAGGRSLGDELGISDEMAQILQDTYATLVETVQSQFV